MNQKELEQFVTWTLENKVSAYEIQHTLNGIVNLTDYVKAADVVEYMKQLEKKAE